jgi:hypothetical protein
MVFTFFVRSLTRSVRVYYCCSGWAKQNPWQRVVWPVRAQMCGGTTGIFRAETSSHVCLSLYIYICVCVFVRVVENGNDVEQDTKGEYNM